MLFDVTLYSYDYEENARLKSWNSYEAFQVEADEYDLAIVVAEFNDRLKTIRRNKMELNLVIAERELVKLLKKVELINDLPEGGANALGVTVPTEHDIRHAEHLVEAARDRLSEFNSASAGDEIEKMIGWKWEMRRADDDSILTIEQFREEAKKLQNY